MSNDYSAFGSDFADDAMFEIPVWESSEPVELVVRAAQCGSKDGRVWLKVVFDISGEPGYDEIVEFLSPPRSSDTPRQKRRNLAQRMGFSNATGYDLRRFEGDTSELVGLTCWATLKIKTNRDGERVNVVGEYVER